MMGVYARPDSTYYWLALEKSKSRPIRESTRIPVDGVGKTITKVGWNVALFVLALFRPERYPRNAGVTEVYHHA